MISRYDYYYILEGEGEEGEQLRGGERCGHVGSSVVLEVLVKV